MIHSETSFVRCDLRALFVRWARVFVACAALLFSNAFARAATVDLEDLSLAPNSFYNGNPGGLTPTDSAGVLAF